MSESRILHSGDFMQPGDGEPIRSVITTSPFATVVVWHIKVGQRIAPHVHPSGQDTWTVLGGTGDYELDAHGTTQRLVPGDVAVAGPGQIHGVHNVGTVPLIFISVVCPQDAGFELL